MGTNDCDCKWLWAEKVPDWLRIDLPVNTQGLDNWRSEQLQTFIGLFDAPWLQFSQTLHLWKYLCVHCVSWSRVIYFRLWAIIELNKYGGVDALCNAHSARMVNHMIPGLWCPTTRARDSHISCVISYFMTLLMVIANGCLRWVWFNHHQYSYGPLDLANYWSSIHTRYRPTSPMLSLIGDKLSLQVDPRVHRNTSSTKQSIAENHVFNSSERGIIWVT